MIRLPTIGRRAAAAPSPEDPRWSAATTAAPELKTGTLGPILAGLAVIAVAFGGFGAWAALAPLNSAAVAPGVVTVDSNRKTVQHLEGRIVPRSRVRGGGRVAARPPLGELDATPARAQPAALLAEWRALRAGEARLLA